jgi:hypothetical protein
MDGRWTIRWQPWVGGTPGGYKVGGREPWPTEEPTPVVPCDDVAVERAARGLARAFGEEVGFADWRRVAETALRAAGETP